jgi:RNA polymerase sigma factor (TIGR02999 family)
MAREKRHVTLQATALVNETYLRLVQIDRVQWRDRTHFFAVAARVMRRILVDAARARRSNKRGGDAAAVTLDESSLATEAADLDLLALDRALDGLRAEYPRQCEVVELRYFGGLNLDETADTLAVSRDTVKRDWRFARLWLLRALRGEGDAV